MDSQMIEHRNEATVVGKLYACFDNCSPQVKLTTKGTDDCVGKGQSHLRDFNIESSGRGKLVCVCVKSESIESN